MEKDKTELTEEEQLQAKAQAAIKLSQDLPASTFAAVPDEDIVDLQISGQFGRVLNRVLEYLYQSEPEKEVLTAANAVKNNFDGMDQEDITLHAISLWAVSNLLADFSVQSGIQNKTKIYDKNKIMSHIFGGVTSDEPLKPLTAEELKEYREKEKTTKKDAKDTDDPAVFQKRRDARRAHRDSQRDEYNQKNISDEDLEVRKNKSKKDKPNPED